jgi:hypothetical protein
MHERKNRSGPLGKFGVRHYLPFRSRSALNSSDTWQSIELGSGSSPTPTLGQAARIIRFLLARRDFENRLTVLNAGRAAEALIFDCGHLDRRVR